MHYDFSLSMVTQLAFQAGRSQRKQILTSKKLKRGFLANIRPPKPFSLHTLS